MSPFRYAIAISSPDGGRFEEVDALVDTGPATHGCPARC